MTKDEILAMYSELLAQFKADDRNDPTECEKHAYNGVRSNVHWALQCKVGAPPKPHAADDGDPEMHHMRQKSHFKNLWKRTDEMVTAAGLTLKGQVS